MSSVISIIQLSVKITTHSTIANRTRHPMSQSLVDTDSNHPVMQALRTNRDWLILKLGEPPDNPTVPTITEMINSSVNLQKSLSKRLSGTRRKIWYEAANTSDKVRIDSASSKDSAAWILTLPRTPYLTVEALIFRVMHDDVLSPGSGHSGNHPIQMQM